MPASLQALHRCNGLPDHKATHTGSISGINPTATDKAKAVSYTHLLAEAPSYGQPITLYDTRSAGAEAYRLLAEEVINREGE